MESGYDRGVERSHDLAVQGLIFLVAVSCRTAVFASYWCLDDWGQLGAAAGLVPYDFSARWLSQHLWWKAMLPLGELNPFAQTALRLVIHGLAATTVFRVGRNLRLSPAGSTLAGLYFAASPIAFTILFWASGIQELLAGCFALLAVERCLESGVRNQLAALVFGVLSLLSKESAFGLPILCVIVMAGRRQAAPREIRIRAIVTAILLVAAVVEGALVWDHFATGPEDPYRLGGPRVIIGNLGTYGWWIASPGPAFASRITVPMVIVGLAGCGICLTWGIVAWVHGRRLPLLLLLCGGLSLAPALPLAHQTHPYLAYVAVSALALIMAEVLPARRMGVWAVAAMMLAAGAWGHWSTTARVQRATASGLPADPVVRASLLAKEAAQILATHRAADGSPSRGCYAILQPPISPARVNEAAQRGAEAVLPSPLYSALGGSIGPTMILRCEEPVKWVNSLTGLAVDCQVFCEAGKGLISWGGIWHGLLNSALLDISLRHFDRAAAAMNRAAEIDAVFQGFHFDDRQIPGVRRSLRAQAAEFQNWLRAGGTKQAAPNCDPAALEALLTELLQTIGSP